MKLHRHTLLNSVTRLGAFTLLEILVAVAVLAVLALIMVGILDSTAKVTGSSQQRMSADSGARQALDRIGADILAALRREDLHDVVEKRPGNDRIVFFAQAEGYGGDRGISQVSYCGSDHPDLGSASENFGNGVLLRGSSGKNWTGTGQLSFGAAPSLPAMDASQMELAAADIFRFELGFLMGDGRIETTLPPVSGNAYLLTANRSAPAADQVRAVIVSIAALDQRGRVLIDDATLAALPGKLVDAARVAAGAQDNILQVWRNAIQADTDLPPPVRNAIKVYQRVYFLQN